MARHEKKPKRREVEFDIQFFWFRLRVKYLIEW